jgi:PAS domain S-box-containing protein
MAFSFDRKYLFAWSLTLLVLGAFSILNLRSTAQLRANVASVEQGHRVMEALAAVNRSLLEMETGARGFLLTGDIDYLAPYLTAIERYEPAMDTLARQVGRSEDFSRLRALADRKRLHMARLVGLSGEDNLGALALLRSGAGRAQMDALQAHMATMTAKVQARLAEQRTASDASVRTNQAVGAVLGLALAVTLGMIQIFMYRELRHRQRMAQAEQEATHVLEQRVDERTEALRQASRALELSERNMRSVFESVPESILTVDASRSIAMANPSAAAAFGVPIEALIGTPVTLWIPRHGDEPHLLDPPGPEEIAAAGADPVRRIATVNARRHDGSTFPADATFSCSGGDDACTVVLRDITDRRRAEVELRQSEARLRKVLAVLPDAVIVQSVGRISYVNPGGARLFGADESQILGTSTLQLMHPDSRPLVRSRIDDLLSGVPATSTVELQVLRFDGTSRTVLSTATVIDDHGSLAIVVVLRDVTDLRRMQRELATSHADLQRLVAAQGQIAENERRRIARELHDDLQQTMAAIKMDLAAATDRLGPSPAQVPALLDSARVLADTAIASTRRIINDLRPQILDDLGLVPALHNLASEFGRRSGIECRFATSGTEDPEVTGSSEVATCLYRVAQEALNNIAKHSGARHATITLAADPVGLTLRVDDDGRGIASDECRKLGSFGLIGMHERVRGFGGSLLVHTRPDGGTRVEAALPAQVARTDSSVVENTQCEPALGGHH